MTHDEMIEVIQAHKEGKQIQFNHHRSGDSWGDTNPPLWNFELNNYRAKPEPREFYILLDKSGKVLYTVGDIKDCKKALKACVTNSIIKVREVLEGEE